MFNKVVIKGSEYIIKHVKQNNISEYTLYHMNQQIGKIETFDVSTISYFHIESQYRNNGYGSFLLNYLADKLKQQQYSVLTVTPSTTSINFYKQNGFDQYYKLKYCVIRWFYKLDKHKYHKFL